MKRLHIIFFGILCACLSLSAQFTYPFQNINLSDEERISNLLSLLTIDEKISLLSTNLEIPRLGIRNANHSEGLHGLTLGGSGNWGGYRIVHGNVVKNEYYTTTFPQAYGLGETWDTELIQKVGDIEATEVRYYAQNERYKKLGLVVRAPNADLARDLRWGRTEESFGEDPYLVGEMSAAFIKGLQGDNPRYWKTASLMKHFLANSNEDGRDSTSSDFDKQLFHEYYSYPFRKGVIKGGSQSFMAAYNGWNGPAMMVHPVLKEVRKNWNMKGIICTDGGALGLLVNAHKSYPTLAEGAAETVKASVGQFLDDYSVAIYDALKQNVLTEAEIDEAIQGNLYVALKLGLLDADQTILPYAHIGTTDTIAPWNNQIVKDFVRLVTAKSAVLLKNDKNFLPLDKKKIKSVAIIGPRSDEVLLDWYSGTPPYAITILQGIKDALGDQVEVYYEPSDAAGKAYDAAKKADIAIVCIGNHVYGTDPKWKYSPVPSDGREAVDRKSLTLEQEDLAKIVYSANPNTLLVLVSSFPFAINWSQENIPAILHITNNSQELGNGVADVIFGKFNPAGRTTQTWVKSITDLPPMMDYDIRNGRTYMYAKRTPLYPFGFGLSYTNFAYSKMTLSSAKFNPNEPLTVSVDIKNTGAKDGDEVVQLYISHPNSKEKRPEKQLKGFNRIYLKVGETKTVQFTLEAEDLSYWNMDKDSFILEPGKAELKIGASSSDIKLTKTILIP